MHTPYPKPIWDPRHPIPAGSTATGRGRNAGFFEIYTSASVDIGIHAAASQKPGLRRAGLSPHGDRERAPGRESRAIWARGRAASGRGLRFGRSSASAGADLSGWRTQNLWMRPLPERLPALTEPRYRRRLLLVRASGCLRRSQRKVAASTKPSRSGEQMPQALAPDPGPIAVPDPVAIANPMSDREARSPKPEDRSPKPEARSPKPEGLGTGPATTPSRCQPAPPAPAPAPRPPTRPAPRGCSGG